MNGVENGDKHGEQRTIEKFGVQRVTQPGLPFFTWQLWLEARDTHTKANTGALIHITKNDTHMHANTLQVHS